MGLFKYPSVEYPTVIRGYIEGPVRWEALDGSQIYHLENMKLKNQGPIWVEGKKYAITHLQKKSHKGWLLMSPYIFHWWNFTKLQDPNKPGTEEGWYGRTPGWRWQVATQDHILWIASKGYLGKHWD